MIDVRSINFKSPYLNCNQKVNQSNQDFKTAKTWSDSFQHKTTNNDVSFKWNTSSKKAEKTFSMLNEMISEKSPIKDLTDGINELAVIHIGKGLDSKNRYTVLRSKAYKIYDHLDSETRDKHKKLTEAIQYLTENIIKAKQPEFEKNNEAFTEALAKFNFMPLCYRKRVLGDLSEHLLSTEHPLKMNIKTTANPRQIFEVFAEASKDKDCHDIIKKSVTDFVDSRIGSDSLDDFKPYDEVFSALADNIPALEETLKKFNEKVTNFATYRVNQALFSPK